MRVKKFARVYNSVRYKLETEKNYVSDYFVVVREWENFDCVVIALYYESEKFCLLVYKCVRYKLETEKKFVWIIILL